MSLFDSGQDGESLPLAGAEVTLYQGFIEAAEANDTLERLIAETPWQQDRIRIAGKWIPVPRLQAWYGDSRSLYAYSGITLNPLPWTPLLASLKDRVEARSGCLFNSVLVNYYRDGRDSVSWHADDEAELGADPVIASLSLGADRTFRFRPKRRQAQSVSCQLANGSLLLMGSGTQINWQHEIPKEKALTLPRLNLTFRFIPGVQDQT